MSLNDKLGAVVTEASITKHSSYGRRARTRPLPTYLELRLAADGGALLAWDQVNRTGQTVTRYADAPPGDTFGPTHELRNGAQLVGLAMRPDGSAAVALERSGDLTIRHRPDGARAFVPLGRPTFDRVVEGDLEYAPSGHLEFAWSFVDDGHAEVDVARRP